MGAVDANARVLLIFAALTAIFVGIGWAVGTVFLNDWVTGAVFFLVIAGLMNFISYFFSSKIVLMSYRARPVTEAEASSVQDSPSSVSDRWDADASGRHRTHADAQRLRHWQKSQACHGGATKVC